MPDQPDLRTKLIEAMQRAADKWMVEGGIENRLCPFLVDVLLSLPGIAIVSADDIRRALRHMDPAASLDEQRLRAKAQLALLAAADAAEAQTNA